MKVQITLDDDLVKRIDDFADNIYMSRSGFISLASVQYLNQQSAVQAMVDLSLTFRKIAESGKIDHETMEELEDFERLARIIGENLL